MLDFEGPIGPETVDALLLARVQLEGLFGIAQAHIHTIDKEQLDIPMPAGMVEERQVISPFSTIPKR